MGRVRNPAGPITVRGVTYESRRACAEALGVSVKTVHSASSTGRTEFIGLGNRNPNPYELPVCIRGKTYKSIKSAAKAIGVKPCTISTALARGTIDRVGIGKGKGSKKALGGRKAKPFSIGPVKFQSCREASRELGFCDNYVSNVLRLNTPARMQNLMAAAMSYAMRREKLSQE